jgi:DNA-binding IclR family transcriptional regulator
MEHNSMTILKSLDRALELIDVLEQAGRPMSVAELGKLLKVNRTTLYATLNTFVSRDYLEKDPTTGFYSIGLKPVEIGLGYRRKYPFIQMMDAQALQISRKWNLQVNVGVFRAPDRVIVLSTHSPGSAPGTSYLFFPSNINFPAYASSLGKAFLCEMEDEELNATLDKIPLLPLTKNTYTDKTALFQHLRELKQNGYSYEDNEYMENIRCLGVGVKDHTKRVVAGMSVVLTPFIDEDQRKQIISELISVKSLISYNLGYHNH